MAFLPFAQRGGRGRAKRERRGCPTVDSFDQSAKRSETQEGVHTSPSRTSFQIMAITVQTPQSFLTTSQNAIPEIRNAKLVDPSTIPYPKYSMPQSNP